MPDLSKLFVAIRRSPQDFLNTKEGGEFERRIMLGLDRSGFNRLVSEDIPNEESRILRHWARAKHGEEISNPIELRSHYWHQPCGSQSFPDILVFSGNRLFCLEPKFSSGKHGRPMWNGGLPRQNGIYILGAYKRGDATFFMGRDLVNPDDSAMLYRSLERAKKYVEAVNARAMSEHPYGFTAYVRNTFEQKRIYSQGAVLDFFDNPNRRRLEDSVIAYVTSHV